MSQLQEPDKRRWGGSMDLSLGGLHISKYAYSWELVSYL